MVTDGEHTDGIVKESICRTDVIKKDNTDITLITLAAGQASGAFSVGVDGKSVPPTRNCNVKCYRQTSPQPVDCKLDEADDFTCPNDGSNGYGLVFPDVQAEDCGMFYLDYYASSPYPIANVPGGADLTVALDQLDNLIATTCLDVLFVCWTMTSCDSPVSLVIHARGSPIIHALASDIKCDINGNVVNGTLVYRSDVPSEPEIGSPHGEYMIQCVAPPGPGGGGREPRPRVLGREGRVRGFSRGAGAQV